MKRMHALVCLALLALVAPIAGCAAVQGRETAGQYADDASITTKVKAEIIKAQSLKGFQISVETMQGTVQLSGFVDTRAQKDQAGQIAGGISGVRAVQNNLLVKQAQ